MFNNNGPSGKDVNVNTGVETFWSSISSLSVGCYNDKISLRWLPAAGVDERGYTRYNTEAKVSTCLSHVKINALLKKYDKHMKDLVEAGGDPADGKSVMVPINSKAGLSGLFIEYKKDDNGKPALYLTFARNLTEVGADPANIIRYKFGELSLKVDMSPETGGGTQEEDHAEFDYFMDILRSHILMTGLNSHSTKYSNAFSKKTFGASAQPADGMNANIGADAFAGMVPDTDGFSVFS